MRDVINAVCSIDYTNNAVVCSGVEFIVLDCVWFFTNLFVSQTEIELVLPFIIEENIPHFLTKLFVETKNFSIKLQCIWALRNFTSFDDKCRKLFLQTEFSKDKDDGCLFDKLVTHILEVVASEKPNVSLVNLDSGEVSSGLQKTWEKTMLKLFEQSMEFIRNMLNYRELGFLKSHPTNTSYAHMFLPLFHAFLKGCKNDHLLRQSCLIMSLLITANLKNDGDRENTETNNLTLRLFDEDLIRYTIPLLLHKNKEVHISAVRFLGDVLFGPRANIKRLIGMGVVGPIYELSKSSDSNVRKEACWALSNCASVGDECLMTIVDAPVFFAPLNGSDKNQKVERIQGLTWMLRLFAAEINSSVKFEIAWFLLNVAKGGKPSVTVELLNAEAHILMAKFLEEHVDSMVNNHLLVMDTVEYFGEIANYQNFPKDQLSCLYATTEYLVFMISKWKNQPQKKDMKRFWKGYENINRVLFATGVEDRTR